MPSGTVMLVAIRRSGWSRSIVAGGHDRRSTRQALELPLIAFEARLAQTKPDEAVAAQVDEREDEGNCPPSTPVNESMSARAAAYQKQITGLDPGSAVVLNNVKFDGCRQSDGTMLEAKGPGYAQFIVASADAVQSWYQGETSILEQAERQAEAALADNRKLEWHFAEKLASEYYARKFRASPYARTIVAV